MHEFRGKFEEQWSVTSCQPKPSLKTVESKAISNSFGTGTTFSSAIKNQQSTGSSGY
jgi:hypothetical protein